jgi:low affinity Fe/Cu permease
MRVDRLVRRFATRAPALVGSPWTLLVALLVTIVWLVAGPFLHWSNDWVLVPATVTSLGAFLLVLVLQYTQNRDTRAIQLKLDELIRSVESARTDLVRLESRTDEELGEIEEEFRELRDQQ